MTFSIVARDAQKGTLGVAVTTRFFGLASLCPFARIGVGAMPTQALVNPTYVPRGLELLEHGLTPHEVAERLWEADGGREHRQLHLIHASGRGTARSGTECIDCLGIRRATAVQ